MAAIGKETRQETRHEDLASEQLPRSRSRIRVRPAIRLTDRDVAELVRETDLSIRTIQRWAAGCPCEAVTIRRITRAIETLGLTVQRRRAQAA